MRKTRLTIVMSAVWLASALAYGHAHATTAEAATALFCPNDGMLYQGSCVDLGGEEACANACRAAYQDPDHGGYCTPSGQCCICEY